MVITDGFALLIVIPSIALVALIFVWLALDILGFMIRAVTSIFELFP